MTFDMQNFEIDAPYVKFGTEYGEWPVSTELMSGHKLIYSFGVGTDISWDVGMIKAYDCLIYAFDPTPVSLAWIQHQKLPSGFRFNPIGLADYDGTISLSPPRTRGFVSFFNPSGGNDPAAADAVDVPVKTLSTLMDAYSHSRLDILKMDIEGSEYGVVAWLCKSNVRPAQILIEYHHGMYGYTIQDTHKANLLLANMGYRRFYKSVTTREQGFVLYEKLIEIRSMEVK